MNFSWYTLLSMLAMWWVGVLLTGNSPTKADGYITIIVLFISLFWYAFSLRNKKRR